MLRNVDLVIWTFQWVKHETVVEGFSRSQKPDVQMNKINFKHY